MAEAGLIIFALSYLIMPIYGLIWLGIRAERRNNAWIMEDQKRTLGIITRQRYRGRR